MKASRSALRDLARQRIDILLSVALQTAKKDLRLAQRQAEIAKRIRLRYNIRLPYEKKQLFCKGCKKLIVPGINARVRLGFKPKAIKITCFECGHVYRKIISNFSKVRHA